MNRHLSGRGRLLRRVAGLAAVLGLIALAGCASAPACKAEGPDTVCTAQGAVRGVADNGTRAFKGIPYAQAPVGPLRWQPTAPPTPWQGTRDGSRFGAICPQLAGPNVVGDEDCLTLNVWTPLAAPGKPLPVMVFFPGGGNHGFSGQGAPAFVFGGVNYNGQQLVPEGVVFVSFNYRLGALGFLAHPALSAQDARKVSGNYGSLDQIAMLRWVHDNIAAFGGDPRRVFLFGTSAGGGNICSLMAAPAARGLFHGVAMQSSVPTGCELPTLSDVEAGTGQRVAEALACTGPDAAACLRAEPAEQIVRAVPGSFGVLPRVYGPNLDGQVFPEQPLAMISRGAHPHMPVIIGNDASETTLFVNAVGPTTDAASYEASIAKTFGPGAVQRIVAAYPPGAQPREQLVKLTTDALFTCQSRRVARALARNQREPVYRYLFAHALENDPEFKAQGAVHTVEHMYFFPWQGKYRPTADDLQLQRTMVGLWTRMAREGSLAGAVPAWPAAQPGDAYLLIRPTPSATTLDEAQCDFWDSVKLPWPHL